MRRVVTLVVLSLLVSVAPARADLINLGNGMIYDTVQDLTWLQDTVLTRTQGLDSRGRLTNDAAVEWVSHLTFGGYDDWRLPRMLEPGGNYAHATFNNSESEISTLMAGLGWYWDPVIMADRLFYSPGSPGFVAGSTGPFLGLESDQGIRRYWVESPDVVGGCGFYCYAWFTSYELEYAWYHSQTANVWAVRDGMVRAPEPSTLLTLALGGMALLVRRRRARRA